MSERVSNRDIRAKADEILDRGIDNLWYAIVPANWVEKDRPLGLTRLGTRLVVWRDGQDKLHVQRDICPHRGAPLSKGIVLNGNLTCGYHGVQVDGDGTIVEVPALPGCPLVGKKNAVRTFPTEVVQGVVFAYLGDAEEPPAFAPPEEFTDPAWTGFPCSATWATNYRYALDNLVDPMHGAYLHADSFTLAYGSKDDTFRVRQTDSGFVVEKEKQVGVNFDWTEFGDTGAHWVRLDIPYPPAAGPGGHMRIVGFTTPIDADSCQVFFWRMRKVEGWQRDLWRFLYKNRLEERHWHVLEQDRVMLEDMEPDAREHENLYQHDIGVSYLRRLLTKQARDRAKQLAERAPAAAAE